MDIILLLLFMAPFIFIGAALTFNIKGMRDSAIRRNGESEEFGRKFRTPVMLTGIIFMALPVVVILGSVVRML
ncbi:MULTISPECIES: hypothetical protein [unclassified Streptomyces]|uniref:hypothetical protein n=1 Tax=unclassified Streptomyces TaxID=2593676 RepID=UPI0029B7A7A5|nr:MULTISPECIES: hypothetical protein [unclassified Streptomyces]MDX3772439.1 hypothetical protein [Streptomyces sp. AK08-01B]MDX3821941.1 hypothetical protein [Streptomyces sp. AK08-01A]